MAAIGHLWNTFLPITRLLVDVETWIWWQNLCFSGLESKLNTLDSHNINILKFVYKNLNCLPQTAIIVDFFGNNPASNSPINNHF